MTAAAVAAMAGTTAMPGGDTLGVPPGVGAFSRENRDLTFCPGGMTSRTRKTLGIEGTEFFKFLTTFKTFKFIDRHRRQPVT